MKIITVYSRGCIHQYKSKTVWHFCKGCRRARVRAKKRCFSWKIKTIVKRKADANKQWDRQMGKIAFLAKVIKEV